MTIECIYIARHGYRLNWVTDDWKSVTGLPRDPPLADFGLTQARELAERFISLPEEERPTAIFSSPYYRCLQTAKPTAEVLQIPLYVEHGLSEWYSPAPSGTGLHPRPAPAAELRTYIPGIDESWQSLYYPSRKGEDMDEVHDRAGVLMRALIPTVEHRFEGKHKRILLVGHAATVIAITRELTGDRALAMRVGCCSLTDLQRTQGASGWDVKKLADGGHLQEGVSRDWGFEDAVVIDGKVVQHVGEPGTETEVDQPVGLQRDLLPTELHAHM